MHTQSKKLLPLWFRLGQEWWFVDNNVEQWAIMSSVKDRFAYLVAVPMACCLFVQRSVDDRAKGQLHCTDKAHTGGAPSRLGRRSQGNYRGELQWEYQTWNCNLNSHSSIYSFLLIHFLFIDHFFYLFTGRRFQLNRWIMSFSKLDK